MIYIDNNCTNPYFNLASEEYFLKHKTEEYFMLWRNEPSIIIGKNQNTLSEINLEFVKENNIPVVRRLTGGGAVFHDLGNLNFTFIVNDNSSFTDFRRFAEPIIAVLKKLDINAEFSGRNDILIEGKKFSGNAQCKFKSRVMHHGTVLFSADMANLSGALKTKSVKFSDKSVKSVVSRVTNVTEHLKAPLTVTEFEKMIFSGIEKKGFTEEETTAIENLVKTKYETWEWNYGKSPDYNFTNEMKFKGGTVEVKLNVELGVMKEVNIYGDFFGETDVKDLEMALTGARHEYKEVLNVLSKFEINKYLLNITAEDLVQVFF